MSAIWRPDAPLADRPWLTPLMRDALTDPADRALDAPVGGAGRAPAWASAWFDPWADDQLARAAAAGDEKAAAASLQALRRGADVIVTGQQPGFLGGPLYTLLKTATCIAAARRRSAAGRPTVPLFWSGGDDDDLDEALDGVVWDPRRRAFLKPLAPESARGRRIGALPGILLGAAEAAWLAEQGEAGAAWAAWWRRTMASGTDWGRLHADALRRLYRRHGLLTVSGDDPALMAAAAPFTARLIGRADELAAAARTRGAELEARGHHAQIGEPSLAKPFQRTDGDRRLRLDSAAAAAAVPPAELRLGVLFRSPVQDWLFRPAAVVVGPGERAYLEQLKPVYQALDLPRAPLVPRAFATFGGEQDGEAELPDAAPAAAEVIASAAAALAAALRAAGAAAPDAEARQTSDRWRGAVETALRRAHRHAAAPADAAPWRRPGGRQERRLPSFWYAALDPEGAGSLIDLAADHLDRWLAGDAREYRLRAPRPLEETR